MLTTLRRIVLEFSQEAELQNALERMVYSVKKAMKTDCCSIYLADYHQQHFLLMASDGLAKTSVGETSIGFSEGLVGLVGQREEPLNIADAQQHQDYMHAPEVEEDDFNAFLGTPIIHQRKVLGILAIQQKESRHYTENDEAFLVTLSAQLASALANAEVKNLLSHQQQKNHGVKQLHGIAGAPGIALSEIIVCQPQADLAAVSLKKSTDSQKQLLRFEQAVEKTRIEFNVLSSQLSEAIDDDSLAIFDVYKQLLEQASLGHEVAAKISKGWRADSALKLVIEHYISQFEAIEDSYFRERASDIRDLGTRLLVNIQQQAKEELELPNEFILLAQDVSASLVAQYQHQGLLGIISLSGSNNSHAAILARSLGLPAIMGVNAFVLGQLHQQQAIIDCYSGELFINPDEGLIQEYQYLLSQEKALTNKVMEVAQLPCITQDGRAIEVLLNAGLSAGFEHSTKLGALGIGLYRTEIPFMNRNCFPSEQEQTQLYRKVLQAFPKHGVTMRTLDVGGDKSLPYFPINEENPFLGWRGIRITLDHPEIFLVQVRAMLRANQGLNNLEIMLPMISGVEEIDEANRLINQAFFELKAELTKDITTELMSVSNEDGHLTLQQAQQKAQAVSAKLVRPKVGIMLEVPSVIFQMEALAKRVDFFSVGSNDLTQYLLAVDRNNSQVANLYDAFHPAVLNALNSIAQQSAQYLTPISLCGELASQPAGAILLLAMGFDKISMNGHNVPRIKWVIRHISFEQAQNILDKALTLTTAKQVHSYLNEQLEVLGLGGFIRAGY
ncbi:phosphoenolpyruvate--protein phosphotransferase [Colwellia demingiae]|uniref:Phosphoenolpyruvate--protein phosphotransferase n=1 Tax=Colwellia demingiae TaxID=89401 RepID=A0A5C6QEL6_9GAMM|nr:phosphoenolpyruvate--protein phosphotransferase [Colwellia demingiae]TWX67191.1 phosphoenolpyruvate--protein phosphotransferase [Colwellia demingiae]